MANTAGTTELTPLLGVAEGAAEGDEDARYSGEAFNDADRPPLARHFAGGAPASTWRSGSCGMLNGTLSVAIGGGFAMLFVRTELAGPFVALSLAMGYLLQRCFDAVEPFAFAPVRHPFDKL